MRDEGAGPLENFVSEHAPEWYAEKFRADHLTGGHVIKLGPGNEAAAKKALAAWPGGLQLGGGVTLENAKGWIEAGASHVIITSALFSQAGHFLESQAKRFVEEVGADRLVVDLSCRKTASGWTVAMNRWQTLTDLDITTETLDRLAPYCAEFLIHAADVEGLCGGVDINLVKHLSAWGKKPLTYAGGATNLSDLEWIDKESNGRIDVTVGSALDLFGGQGVTYNNLVKWNMRA